MLRLTKNVEYAVIILCHLSHNKGKLSSAQKIATTYNISKSLVAKILKVLTKQELISSIKGVFGGYQLKEELSKISLKQLINFVEGPFGLTECSTFEDKSKIKCSAYTKCPAKASLKKINESFDAIFSEVTLEDIASNNISLDKKKQIVKNNFLSKQAAS